MSGQWIREPANGTTIIFVHGIISDGEKCWTNDNGTHWARLLSEEHELGPVGIYNFTYYTAIASGTYSIGDAVDSLREELRLNKVISRSKNWIFVCHSMGGIVVRRFLVANVIDLKEKGISVGLFFVASPSLGSRYANLLESIINLFGHIQAEALKFSQSNTWLNDLDKDFLNLKEKAHLKIRGKEIVEDKFFVLTRFFRRQVVERFSGARYFQEPVVIPKSDHMSIAKPNDQSAFQHRLLKQFVLDCIDDWRPSCEDSAAQDEHAVAFFKKALEIPTDAIVWNDAEYDHLLKDFWGSDPIRGNQALEALLKRGDEGEEHVFRNKLFVGTTQVYRRWMQYIHARHETCGNRLLKLVQETNAWFGDRMIAAQLMCGLPRSTPMQDPLYMLTRQYFDHSADSRNCLEPTDNFHIDNDGAHASMLAYACAGGSGVHMWKCAAGSKTGWEKVRTTGFEAACYSFARGNIDSQSTIFNFLTHATNDDDYEHRMIELDKFEIDLPEGCEGISLQECWAQAHLESFVRWMRSDVIDELLLSWARHPHVRVRNFCAQILEKLTLPRTEKELLDWVSRETNDDVRLSVQNALFNVQCFSKNPKFLKEASLGESNASNEYMVMLAKHGHRHPSVGKKMCSVNWFDRAMAALACGYLSDQELLGDTTDLLQGIEYPMQSVLINCALALAGRKDRQLSLHLILSRAGDMTNDYERLLDVRRLKPPLKLAILDALKADARDDEINAWQIELGPISLPA